MHKLYFSTSHFNISNLAFISLFSLFSTIVYADIKVDSLPSHQSFTGLTNTPNAQVLETGNFSLSYGQGVPYKNGIGDLDNWVVSVGLFPGFEANGRIVTKTYDCNGYTDPNCGIRDLSASLKYQFPFVYDYTGFNLAIGTQDLGGAANNFQTTYIVADKTLENWPVRFSAGYGQSKLSSGILDGGFAGIEIQPLSFLQITGEYDSTEFNSSIKAVTPKSLLPYDMTASIDYQIYTTRENTDNNIWGASLSVPLVGYIDTKKMNMTKPSANKKQLLQTSLADHDSASLLSLIHTLEKEGFINIQIGTSKNKTVVIALENRRYNRNQMDGAGVALGLISANVGQSIAADLDLKNSHSPNIEMIMLTNGIPMIAISTSSQCYREFLNSGTACKQTKISTTNLANTLNNTQWKHEKVNNGFGRSQIILSPAMNYALATEYGMFDYSLALAANLYIPLWKGFAIDTRYLLHIDDSDDYQNGGYWENQAYQSEIDRAVAHQTFRLPYNFMTQFSAGYILSGYLGGQNETVWVSPQGYHSFGVQISEFTYKDDTDDAGNIMQDKGTRLGRYRLSVPNLNWQLEVEAGEFWEGDKGYQITTNHWLGDANAHASFLDSEDEQFVTIGISLPLNFWRGMKPNYVQVRGTDQYILSAQTRVGETHNFLNNGLGTQLDFQHNLERQYLNRNRLSSSYFESNLQRLRNAYLRYLSVTH